MITLTELSKLLAGILANVWHLHHLTDNYNEHLRLNTLYNELIEDFDNLCESTVQHDEIPSGTINPEELPTIDDIVVLINVFTDSCKELQQYDLGVDNMIGGLCEKYSKWANYFLTMRV